MHISKNKIELWGNVARAPEVSTTRSGTPVANLTLVMVDQWKDSDGGDHEDSTFIPVECYGKMATWVGENLAPGAFVVVEGRLKNVSWGHGSEKKSKILLSAKHILPVK